MKLIIASVFFIFNLTFIEAQKFTAVTTFQNETAALNEPLKLYFTLNTLANKFAAPNLDDFIILKTPEGPTIIEKTREEVGLVKTDGLKNEVAHQTIYMYLVCPKKTGKFKIENGVFIVDGKNIKCSGAKIVVEDRKLSWEDSAKITESVTLFHIGKGGVGSKNLKIVYKTPEEYDAEKNKIGTGNDLFEITTDSSLFHVHLNDAFVISYKVYKEAALIDFPDNIILSEIRPIEGLEILNGSGTNLKIKENLTRKVVSGTVTLILQASEIGTYKLPVVRGVYGSSLVNSPVVEVIVN